MDSIERIENYAKSLSYEDFKISKLDQDSIIRRLEIIGGTIKNIPNDFKMSQPKILWRKYPEMGDNLIDEYFGVSLKTVWNVVKNDLPKLKEQIQKLL